MRKLAAGLAALLMVGAMAGPSFAGNKGTVKVEEVDIDELPDNSPHPGCVFRVEWFHYADGSDVTWDFTVHPPTSDTSGPGSSVGGGADTLGPEDTNNHHLNLSVVQDLEAALLGSGIEPHPQQGWHVKLSVTGPEGNKYKVFWVECAGYPPRDLGRIGLASNSTSADGGLGITWGVLLAVGALGALALTLRKRALATRRSDD